MNAGYLNIYKHFKCKIFANFSLCFVLAVSKLDLWEHRIRPSWMCVYFSDESDESWRHVDLEVICEIFSWKKASQQLDVNVIYIFFLPHNDFSSSENNHISETKPRRRDRYLIVICFLNSVFLGVKHWIWETMSFSLVIWWKISRFKHYLQKSD